MRIIETLADVAMGLQALERLDPRLADVIALAGDVPLRLQPAGFEGLGNIIASQMISKAAAQKIWLRLLDLCGGSLHAQSLLASSPQSLRSVGLSGAKADTLLRAAKAVDAGALDLEAVCIMDLKDAFAQLTSIKGIGAWTAEVYMMFCAGHPDIFPVGDVALQSAVGHALKLEVRPKGKQLSQIAADWQPWRSVAARLFWAYYAEISKRDANPFTAK